jgi:hypothetical protein
MPSAKEIKRRKIKLVRVLWHIAFLIQLPLFFTFWHFNFSILVGYYWNPLLGILLAGISLWMIWIPLVTIFKKKIKIIAIMWIVNFLIILSTFYVYSSLYSFKNPY